MRIRLAVDVNCPNRAPCFLLTFYLSPLPW